MVDKSQNPIHTAIELIESGGTVSWESSPVVRRIFRSVIFNAQVQEMMSAHEPRQIDVGNHDSMEP
jgi:hypothetical protein